MSEIKQEHIALHEGQQGGQPWRAQLSSLPVHHPWASSVVKHAAVPLTQLRVYNQNCANSAQALATRGAMSSLAWLVATLLSCCLKDRSLHKDRLLLCV